MNIYFIALLTFIFTIFGGMIVFKFRRNFFHTIIAFSAGIFLAVAFFDLIPASFSIVKDFKTASLFLALGFLLFYIMQRFTIIHAHDEEECKDEWHENVGLIGASGLIVHSFLDGLAIGVSFAIDIKLALIVSVAVITHKVGDGIGLVSLMLHHKNSNKKSVLLLVLDAIAPVIGIFFAEFIMIPDYFVGILLAFFAGFFIYMGASDLLPEVNKKDRSFKVLISTLVGFILVYLLNRIVSV